MSVRETAAAGRRERRGVRRDARAANVHDGWNVAIRVSVSGRAEQRLIREGQSANKSIALAFVEIAIEQSAGKPTTACEILQRNCFYHSLVDSCRGWRTGDFLAMSHAYWAVDVETMDPAARSDAGRAALGYQP